MNKNEFQPVADTPDNSIVISRVFSAPRELVWEAMTDPNQVVHWWGPRGFTTTIEKMDFRVGGQWKHVMRGPDGTEYPNKSVFKEIVPPERIVYSHGGGARGEKGINFVATWTFEALAADKTKLTIKMVAASKDDRDFVVQKYGALEGGKQTLTRLSEHLAGRQSQPFVISREYPVSRELMWDLWTDPAHLAKWFGPRGMTAVVSKLDFRPGGLFHYCLKTPEGKEYWGRFVYREIVKPEKMVWVNSFSDKDAGLVRHPFSKDPWPLEMLTEVTFAESKGSTVVTVRWLPLDSTPDERAAFEKGRDSMNQGWGGTMDQLSTYLENLAGRP
ncbi:MAG: SRPBCC family protein [Nibricoccus sp.]